MLINNQYLRRKSLIDRLLTRRHIWLTEFQFLVSSNMRTVKLHFSVDHACLSVWLTQNLSWLLLKNYWCDIIQAVSSLVVHTNNILQFTDFCPFNDVFLGNFPYFSLLMQFEWNVTRLIFTSSYCAF